MGILQQAYAVLTTEALAATIDFHLLESRRAETRAERLWHLVAMEVALTEFEVRVWGEAA